MNVEEFEIWVQEETEHSVLDVADINANDNTLLIDVESIKGIAEAYLQHRVNEISDDVFREYWFDETKVNPSLVDGAIRGYKWFKNKLLKNEK